jgi:methyl-accepting chemotaxis protein
MSWLNNFKIVFKIGLIVALMAIVTIGTVGVAAFRMRAMDEASTDMVTRIDKSNTMSTAGKTTKPAWRKF